MKTVRYRIDREIPITREADVLVAGGGPGGIGAAVMAARAGARTLLVERFGFLGGMASAGEVHPFMWNHADGVCLDKPVYVDWVRAMKRYVAETEGNAEDEAEVRGPGDHLISKDVAMLGAEDICVQSGVDLLYHHTLADALVTDQRIEAVVLSSKSGLTAARAQIYIDCTGDADLAARAGCEFEQGGPSGHCQPMTLCFKLAHVDRQRMPERSEISRLYVQAKERGEIECPREDVLWFNWYDDDVIHFNTTRVIHRSGTDAAELSDAEMEARGQVRQYLTFLRANVPGFEQAVIHSIAHHIGIRETRRVRGINYLTREAFTERARFEDAIARVRYPIDIHNPDGTGTELVHMPEGEWYEIPYGCIVARDTANLLVGGRPISVDHAIHSSMRVMPPACSIGQAAGMAAAMCCDRGSNQRNWTAPACAAPSSTRAPAFRGGPSERLATVSRGR